MFELGQILIGLEIGTSKVCAAVGEVAEGGELNILGLGQARSRGVRKGEVFDAEKAGEDIRQALAEAEEMADVTIESIYLAVTGRHLECANFRGVHTIPTVDRAIDAEDVQLALRNAKYQSCPAGAEIIDSVRQDFLVDDHAVYENPVGVVGARIEARVHVILGHANRLATSRQAVEAAVPVRVEKTVFSGLASALAVLTTEQKQAGAIVVDLGGGTTEFAFFHQGLLRHSGVLAVGGDHVSNDLAYGLRVPLSRAEELKLAHGSALVRKENSAAMSGPAAGSGLTDRPVSLGKLERIMSMRWEETLELLALRLRAADALRLATEGVFLCGGGARTPGIEELAHRIFQLPVHRGLVQSVSGPATVLENPEFATPIGLVRYGAMRARQRPRPRLFSRLTSLAGLTSRRSS